MAVELWRSSNWREIWSHYVSVVCCSLCQLTSNKAHIVQSSHKMASLTSFLLIGGKCLATLESRLVLHMYLILTKCSNAQRAFHRLTVDHKIFNRRIAAISSILAWLTAIKLSWSCYFLKLRRNHKAKMTKRVNKQKLEFYEHKKHDFSLYCKIKIMRVQPHKTFYITNFDKWITLVCMSICFRN